MAVTIEIQQQKSVVSIKITEIISMEQQTQGVTVSRNF